MKLSKVINNFKGSTLAETMVAIVLFGIVLVGILDVCAQNMLMGKRSDLAFNAYSLAKNHLETLKSLSFSSLSSAVETDTIVDATGVSDSDGTFKRNTTVTTNYTSDANLVQVSVTVDYQVKGQYVNKPASLSTVVYQYA